MDDLFTAFNFRVEITVEGIHGFVCEAAFAEVDGLEMTMEPKTFSEGGNNLGQVHLAGSVTFAQLTLKRGMSRDYGLWRWFNEVIKSDRRGLRGQATLVMLAADHTRPEVTFKLRDCLPTKLRAPALNAKEGCLRRGVRRMTKVLNTARKLTKAQLIEIRWNDSGETEVVPSGKSVTVQFNPASLRVAYSNQVQTNDQSNSSSTQYVGKGSSKMSLELVFDVSMPMGEDGGTPQTDVRKVTQEVAFFMTPKPDEDHEDRFLPPGIRFVWGSFMFEGIAESMDETLELWSEDGIPLRATVTMNLSQQGVVFGWNPNATPPPPSAASNGAPAGTTPMQPARAGDSIQAMAGRIGKADSWKQVASLNGIENPRNLVPGQFINLRVQIKTS
jgi:phage tail-like protein